MGQVAALNPRAFMRLFAGVLALLLTWHGAAAAVAAAFDKDFAVVYIDAPTEARYGRIPLDRAILAKGIQKLADAGAKGVVLKFFLDQPKEEASDAAMEAALKRIPVILQARLDDAEPKPNSLPDKFALGGLSAKTAQSGASGWIPLPRFSAVSADVGFIDFDSTVVPMLETYRDRTVKSVCLSAIELATGRKALIEPGRQIRFGDLTLPLDELNRVSTTLTPAKPAPVSAVSFLSLLDGQADAAALKGKVVILAYDGPNIHSADSPLGKMGAHRLFVAVFRALYEGLH